MAVLELTKEQIVDLVRQMPSEEKREVLMLLAANAPAERVMDLALRELAQVAQECKSPGWDGAQATAISVETENAARAFLTALPPDQPVPSIGAEPDGHITLEWHQDARQTLSISIGAGPEVHYAALLGQRKAFGQELFLGKVPSLILELVQRVYAR